MAAMAEICDNDLANLDKISTSSSDIDSPIDDSDYDKDYDYAPSESEVANQNQVTSDSTDSEMDENIEPKLKRLRAETPEPTAKSRWRKQNDERYDRSKRKSRRNLGQAYISDKTKKHVAARELGPPCNCKKNCREKLQGVEVDIFNAFWDLGSWELQNSYLFGCIEVLKKKRSYPKKQKRQESSRTSNAVYSINVNGQAINVCKTEFLSIHGLDKSKGRLNNIVAKKISGIPVPEKDKRGKHLNRPNKIGDNEIDNVMEHIHSIPKYQSHYSRAENANKVYLNCDMTISRLYTEKYVPWCEEKDINPVKEHIYRKIFCTRFNIGFKMPKSDTCKTCDELNIRLETASTENRADEVSQLTIQLNLHKAKAKAMQDLLRQETEQSESNRKKCVISFDLQQALPIPKLTSGPAFYRRKIWLYNLGVHDCTERKGHMFLWTENVAKRGSDEVASILLKFLEKKSEVDDLVIFTYNCPGQNKNWLLMSLWLQLVKEGRFKSITHHFLVCSHTHLPSDRDFALIEKRHRKYALLVFSPNEWHQIIKQSNKKTPFAVTVMEQKDFLNFQPILGNIKKTLRDEDGSPVEFSNAFSFCFKSDNARVMYIKHSVHGTYREIATTKKGRPPQTLLSSLTQKYMEPVKIAQKKINNVKSLLPYIPPVHHGFFNTLQANVDNNQETEEIEMLEI